MDYKVGDVVRIKTNLQVGKNMECVGLYKICWNIGEDYKL